MTIRYLKSPLPERHAPHVHECREPNCPNLHLCQDADRCRVAKDWICGSCADRQEEQQLEEMARDNDRFKREQRNQR